MKIRRKIFRTALRAFVAFVVLSILVTILYRWINPPFTPLMLIRKITIGSPVEHRWVDIRDISHHLIDCAVASEDNNFPGHNGFDFGAIQTAIDERERGRIRGASTISQQTAKNVFLWQGKSWLRKGLEVYFTFLIETFWSKERIMEVYLNEIEMGKGIYGAEAAAQHYFNRNAKNLSHYQAALIVAALPNPLYRNPAKPTAYLTKRAQAVIALSKKTGVIKWDKTSVDRARERYRKREAKRREKIDGQLLKF
ncbi:MAG: monofunctional biosynthetic peptidoglycan transglycosylase [Dysgonamonadaceae bacterium]|jgi:monofunctional biosynthetic peptidoglycan transglycosylase|nr:monofunctional biosynthetic peptidoglycan transglycosylase [Dysgonamonadaceae bacterium]